MKTSPHGPRTRTVFPFALLLFAICCVMLFASGTRPSEANGTGKASPAASVVSGAARAPQADDTDEPPDVSAFRASVGDITAVIVELRGEPGVLRKVNAEKEGRRMSVGEIAEYGLGLYARQDDFFSSLSGRGVRALMRETDVKQIDGSVRHIEYRFTYLLNGLVALRRHRRPRAAEGAPRGDARRSSPAREVPPRQGD